VQHDRRDRAEFHLLRHPPGLLGNIYGEHPAENRLVGRPADRRHQMAPADIPQARTAAMIDVIRLVAANIYVIAVALLVLHVSHGGDE
jgi:hypothetical protein